MGLIKIAEEYYLSFYSSGMDVKSTIKLEFIIKIKNWREI